MKRVATAVETDDGTTIAELTRMEETEIVFQP